MTNKDLADTLGVTRVSVSNWCTNDSQPSIKMLFEIAAVLDVDVRSLLVSNKP
ncbi:helix-turn-helix domain-containing protein [Mucilaginibacter sp. RT5R15]|nr:helix-turn-helix domain-containing protein [Mucilaginibacter flavidus]